MDDLLVYIARELVSNPDEVNVKNNRKESFIWTIYWFISPGNLSAIPMR